MREQTQEDIDKVLANTEVRSVTQEDLDKNPDLEKAGFKEGDRATFPKGDGKPETGLREPTPKELSKARSKNPDVVRQYGEERKARGVREAKKARNI